MEEHSSLETPLEGNSKCEVDFVCPEHLVDAQALEG